MYKFRWMAILNQVSIDMDIWIFLCIYIYIFIYLLMYFYLIIYTHWLFHVYICRCMCMYTYYISISIYIYAYSIDRNISGPLVEKFSSTCKAPISSSWSVKSMAWTVKHWDRDSQTLGAVGAPTSPTIHSRHRSVVKTWHMVYGHPTDLETLRISLLPSGNLT